MKINFKVRLRGLKQVAFEVREKKPGFGAFAGAEEYLSCASFSVTLSDFHAFFCMAQLRLNRVLGPFISSCHLVQNVQY